MSWTSVAQYPAGHRQGGILNDSRTRPLAALVMVILAVLALFWMDRSGHASRSIASVLPNGAPAVHRVDRQSDIYAIYRSLGVWGAHVVHLNRFLNLVEYYPKDESVSMPFPVRTADIRPSYEKGIDSHSWLFIANRTGLVRSATIVLPRKIFDARLEDFRSDFSFTVSDRQVRGWAQDMPFEVTTLEGLSRIAEPVIVNVDAGYFDDDADPRTVAEAMRRACRDVRVLVLCASRDEQEVSQAMRDRLALFASAFLSTFPAVTAR